MATGKAKSPREKGLEFEEGFAKLFGAELTPGSGNQWFAKLDVGGKEVLWSLKHTGTNSLTVTPAILREAIQEATKIGSKGAIPGIAVDISGEAFILMRVGDFAALLSEDVKIAPARSGDAKRARTKMPLAVRRLMEQDD